MDLLQYLDKHPIGGAFLLWVIFFLIIVTSGIVRFIQNAPPLLQISIAYSLLSMLAIVLLVRFNWWKKVGFSTLGKRYDLQLYVVPLVVAFLSLPEGIKVSEFSTITIFALFTFLVGFTEETFFRGFILTTLRPIGAIGSVLISALLFGLPHLLNAIGGLWDPLFTLVDTGAVIGIGVTFAALYIRTGTIWPLIGIHAFIDFTALITQGGLAVPAQPWEALILTALVGIILLAYGLYLIRPSQTNRKKFAMS